MALKVMTCAHSPVEPVGLKAFLNGGYAMENPLRHQMTEYDCGPTSMLNAVSFLFPRKEIPPEIIRSIMLYCLD